MPEPDIGSGSFFYKIKYVFQKPRHRVVTAHPYFCFRY